MQPGQAKALGHSGSSASERQILFSRRLTGARITISQLNTMILILEQKPHYAASGKITSGFVS